MPDELLMRQVPQDLTAEQSLLGAMLVDPNCIPEVIEQVRADDFYAEENKRIFETIYSMFNGAQRIDPVTVLDMLTRMGYYDEAGGRAYLFQLMEVTPGARNVNEYVRIVRDKSLLRQLADAGSEIQQNALEAHGEASGTRCGWTVVPTALLDGKLNKMWLRRQTTKFNGVPYIVQKGAAACFTEEGMKQIKDTLGYYKQNAKVLSETLDELGIWYTGGKSSPYLWLKCPNGMDSWTFFDYLLENANVVGTPGAGFGKNGDGFFRLTAFGDQKRTLEAAERLKKLLAK